MWEELASSTVGFSPQGPVFTYWYTIYLFEIHIPAVSIKAISFVEKILKFAKQCVGDTLDTTRVVEVAIAAFESGKWGYLIEPHLESSAFRSLIQDFCGIGDSSESSNEKGIGMKMSSISIVTCQNSLSGMKGALSIEKRLSS